MKTIVIALAAILTASTSMAQDSQPVHFLFSFGPSVQAGAGNAQGQLVHNGTAQNIVPPMTKKPLYVVGFDITPANGLGGGIRYTTWSEQGSLSATASATDQVKMWGADENAYIVNSSSTVRGDIGYNAGASHSIKRFDALAIYGHSFENGYASIFGGIAHVAIEAERQEGQQRKYLLLNIPPGKPADKIAIQEAYTHTSDSQSKFVGTGPVIGGEVSFCPIGRLLLVARGDVAWFPWGSGSEQSGNWNWTKTGSLVPASGGVDQAPGSDLFAPITVDVPFSLNQKGGVRGTELEGSIRFRIVSGLQVGVGPLWTSYTGLPGVQTWTIPPGYAPEKGHWSAGGASTMTLWAWVGTVSVRF